jgi:hypothetical protein
LKITFAALAGSLISVAGVRPSALFQTARRRSAGHALASSASSCSVVKVSKGVALLAAASSWVTVQVPQKISLDKLCRMGYFMVDECESGSPHKTTKGNGEQPSAL